ncbi:uncharacterized protein DNG_04061 [Cephalotrichum gorgonifer]|uniref:Uncharacterized protein n=1 Tax=Cephalotrichum gorgonifer TaxID=2041049 RepID=A0AAE8MXF1_9PEZI|nr:uncharacterized protein DNG_04061 [Cephalotrichum gorgonifer]
MNSVMSSNMSQPTSFAGLLLRHLQNDLNAYGYDRDYCTQQLLEEQGLTPQEARTLRLRVFDLNHQIRLCQHKMEILTALGSIEQPAPSPQTIINSLSAVTQPSPANSGQLIGVGAPDNPSMSLMHQAAQSSAQVAGGSTPAKRAVKPSQTSNGHPSAKRAKKEVAITPGDEENAGNMIQRLGFWKCRLCTSPKYLAAPQPKQPSAPCKWPLRDIAKMITHFTDMHSEHSPSERCEELGTALDGNRGPFEYWLNRSRSMDVGDGSVMRECIDILLSGRLPPLLRRLSRAAAAFPEDEE